MDIVVAIITAAGGIIGGFLTPLMQDRSAAKALKAKIQLMELVDSWEERMDAKLEGIREKMVTKEYLDLFIKSKAEK